MRDSILADLCLFASGTVIVAVFVLPALAGRHLRRISARRKTRRQPTPAVPQPRQPGPGRPLSDSERADWDLLVAALRTTSSGPPSAARED